jgi:benzylsuccinate CoA-transferase BbsF subunit
VEEDAAELDPISATYGMLAIMGALHHRDRTGQGQMIEIAQGEAGFIATTEAMIEYVWNDREMGPQGNLHRVLAPHGIYPCTGDDRWIAIACGSDEEWSALAHAAGHEEWLEQDAYRTAAGRRAARAELDAAIGAWTAPEDDAALTQLLQEAGVAAFPVMGVFDMLADSHHSHRRDHYELPEEMPMASLLNGNPWHLSAAQPSVRSPVPKYGQHNEEVFGELLGLSSEEVHNLQTEGVIA